jgi:acyl-CoA dehydrogenase
MNQINWNDAILIISSFVFLFMILAYSGILLWLLAVYTGLVMTHFSLSIIAWSILGITALVFLIPAFRRMVISNNIFRLIKNLNLLPTISDTEKEAINAGNVWVEREFFSGNPNLQRLAQELYPTPPPEVQAFLDNQVETVCAMASDWDIYQHKDLPSEVWDYLKKERFFGLMIPKEYGGLGFTPIAYSAVMAKLTSRSFTHVATVGVTNSLGPAKLLLRYGTEAQKAHYLPRLATGEDIPCFALTEPNAGSDAGSITSEGVVFKGEDGKLYLRLNWQKRYITLGAIATLLGLAFQLKDPKNYLGLGENVGITCVLIDTKTEGVTINQRHDPMGVPFYNSPTTGHSVIVPVENIIGGVAGAGKGWKMLMECLASGRGVTFPATAVGISQLVSRVTGAYSIIRQQFGLSIGKFEGVQEPLARIGGFTYMLDALRLYTVGAVETGEQPPVVSAIAKYNSTELARQVIIDGMDIMGGAGICRGSRNLLANIYTAMPIAITVEGANILTRTLMVFGQGVTRCHPYVYDEIQALESQDFVAFDKALWGHIGLIISNGLRNFLLTITRGRIAHSPFSGDVARYYRKLAWASSTFACLTEYALIRFGGNLKRKEKLSGRFADFLSWMYIVTATLRRYQAEGSKEEDLPLVHWSMKYAFYQIQIAIEGIAGNMLPWLPLSWWRINAIGFMPDDKLGSKVAQILQKSSDTRNRLTNSIYLPKDPDQALGRIEQAFAQVMLAEPIWQKIKVGIKEGKLSKNKPMDLPESALKAQIISQEEFNILRLAETLRQDAIQVNAFDIDTSKVIIQ